MGACCWLLEVWKGVARRNGVKTAWRPYLTEIQGVRTLVCVDCGAFVEIVVEL